MSEEQNKEEQLPDTSSPLPETGNLPIGLAGREPETKPTQTLNPKLQTFETMEVHHHGHVHHQKKWKEYLFQFLMLFLAVFCGFLAEYQLEHVIEHKREKQYVKSLVEDLKLDTVGMSISGRINEKSIRGLDSLVRFIWHTPVAKKDARRMYELKFAYTGIFRPVIFSKSTLTQLKHSGNLRLITNVKIVDSVLKYDMASEVMDRWAEKINHLITDNYTAEYLIFNDKFWPNNFASGDEYEKSDFDLLSYDARELAAYASRLTHQKAAMETYINRLVPYQKQRATGLIDYLKKEYHLE